MDSEQTTQLPPANPPLPPPKPRLPLLLVGLFLSLIILGGSYFMFGTKKEEAISPPVSQPYRTTVPTVDQNANWKTHTVELMQFSLQLPNDWSIQEINRRQDFINSTKDCADYLLKDKTNTYATLSIKFICEISDSGPESWPDDTISVKEVNKDSNSINYLIRFFDAENLVYRYATGTILKYEDGDEEKYYTPGLPTNQHTIFMAITDLDYFGPEELKNQYLTTTDTIVSSIKPL